MSRYRLDFGASELDRARALAGALEELLFPAPDAVTTFECGPVSFQVSAYFQDAPDLVAVDAIVAGMFPEAAHGEIMSSAAVSEVPAENWVAVSQAALPPVVAGRFTVHGSHDRHRVPRGPFAIEIDAGEAFGTAHHATTLGCLTAIGELAHRRGFKRVLDLGCGSGVLAIAAARVLPRARIVATDIDPQATVVARENVRRNRLGAGRLPVVTARGLTHPALRGRTFDFIIANILANPLIALANGLARVSPRNGHVVLSGLLVAQAPEVIAAYRTAGFALQSHKRIVGWSTLTLVKR